MSFFDSFLKGRQLKLIFYGGKGGVGKTTCAVSHALTLARSRPDEGFLIVSTDPAHSVHDAVWDLGLPPNLEIRELDAAKALEAFNAQHRDKLHEIASRGTFFDETDTDQLLELSLPGLDELMGFLEIAGWVNSGDFKTVIVDTAPTGHTLRLLEMPRLIGGWLDALDVLLAKHRYMKKLFQGKYQADEIDQFLRELLDSVKTMEKWLTDRKTCRFVPVFLAEPLSLSETENLLSHLKDSRLPVTDMVANRIYPFLDCPVCAGEHHDQVGRLTRFHHRHPRIDIWVAPLYPHEVQGKLLTTLFPRDIAPLSAYRIRKFTPPAGVEKSVEVDSPAQWPSAGLRLLIFAGKGGVGKTTLACATACGIAARQKDARVLIFSTDPAHSLSQCLDTAVGPEPVEIFSRLSAVEIDASADFNALKKAYETELEDFLDGLSSSLDLTFDQQVMEQMMELAPPGLDEVMALNLAMSFLARDDYDLLVLDSAPTGHLIRLLQTPELMDQWLKVIFNLLLKYKRFFRLPKLTARLVEMSKSLKFLKRLLVDPEQSALYAVAVPNRMVFEETADLVSACRDMQIHVPVLFLNMATREKRVCPLCTAISQREKEIRHRFEKLYPGLVQPVVYRSQMELQGRAALEKMAGSLYGDHSF